MIELDGPPVRMASGLLRAGPQVIDSECAGCNLCILVCPVPGCITMKRIDTNTETLSWNERKARGITKLPRRH